MIDQLELRLADLATAVAFPPTPDLTSAVGAKLRARPRQVVWFRRSIPRSLLLAAALALLVVGTALAVRFGLELLTIEFGPVPTGAAPATASPASSGGFGADLELGRKMTIELADTASDFEVLVPAVLGEPDAIYVSDIALRGQVSFIYAPRDDLLASPLLGGGALLITQNRGGPDDGLAHKIVDSTAATVESVQVAGAPGLWISGAPHVFWYLAPDGTFISESNRLVGDTLAWERDGVLYRIEGLITRERALEIAGSMR